MTRTTTMVALLCALGACTGQITTTRSRTHADTTRGANGDLSSTVRNDQGDELLDVQWDGVRKVLVYTIPGRDPIEMPFPALEGAPTEETIDVTSQFIWGQLRGYHDSPGCDIGSHGQTSCTTSCCQDHDECYHVEGCTSSSWLGSSPTDSAAQRDRDSGPGCGGCNSSVTGCFLNPLCHTQAMGCSIGGDGPMRSECGCEQSCYSTTAGRYCTDSCQHDAEPDHMCSGTEMTGCTYSEPSTPRHCEEDPSGEGCPGASDSSGSDDGNPDGDGTNNGSGSGDDPGDGTGNTGNDGSGNTGNNGSGNTGNTGNNGSGNTGNTGNNGSGNTGNTGSGNTGNTGNTGSGDTGNTGSGNTGNTGSGNTGNTGSGNTGNTGSGNTGSGNTGNTGSGNAGSGNTGNTGSGNTGSGNTGSGNTGSGDTGSGNTGSGDDGSGGDGTGY